MHVRRDVGAGSYAERYQRTTQELLVTNAQYIGDNSNGNQQIRADGDVTASLTKDGGINIGGDNHGVVITSVPRAEEPRYTFDITKKTRIPTPAALIGVVSGLITIAGFVTGGFSIKQLVDVFVSGNGVDLTSGTPKGYWWLLVSILAVAIGIIGWSFFRFLRRNVLRLPKRWWFFRGWAGIKEENGRTYPYSLRLAMWCPNCKNQKLRFQQIPATWVDFYDNTGKRTKRDVTKWASMAVCPRDEAHSIAVDISGNDFDDALPR